MSPINKNLSGKSFKVLEVKIYFYKLIVFCSNNELDSVLKRLNDFEQNLEEILETDTTDDSKSPSDEFCDLINFLNEKSFVYKIKYNNIKSNLNYKALTFSLYILSRIKLFLNTRKN